MDSQATMLTLRGNVSKILFNNPDNGYTVLELVVLEKSPTKVIAVGSYLQDKLGQEVILTGEWQQHPKHGKQFHVHSTQTQSGTFSAEKFLIQHIDGIGPSFAQRLQHAFGDKITDILQHAPHRLREVPGIGDVRYQRIMQSWEQQKSSRDVLLTLSQHAVGPALANKIYRCYGEKAMQRLQENPYRIIDEIDGAGFVQADQLALSLGVEKTCAQRLQAGLIHLLNQETRHGHCGGALNRMIQLAAQNLHAGVDLLEQSVSELVAQEAVIVETINEVDYIFIAQLWQQEKQIADKLQDLMAIQSPLNAVNLQQALAIEIQKESLALSHEQQAAIQEALSEKVFVLTGGPGVGKTTLLRLLAKIYQQNQCNVALCAPTGRAAKRLSEVTHLTAKTIHRLLEYDPYSGKFNYNSMNPLPFDVVIIDEASMLDVPLCAAILQAINVKAKVLFVGDVDQLPSVGPGDVLRAMIDSGHIPTFALKTIFRQQQSSQIIVNAHRVNQGILPVADPKLDPDFYLIGANHVDDQLNKVVRVVSERLSARFGFDPIEDVQVLTPMNEGPLGVNAINQLLQKTLNPPGSDKSQIPHFDGILRQGDKVIQVVNNYEKNIFNGDIGKIVLINEQARKVLVKFEQVIEYSIKELSELKLAYAISIHKSQGSEYPAVVILLSKAQSIMLKRNLLYTAMTRGKSCVVIITDKQALGYAVHQHKRISRISTLEERLQHAR